MAEHLANFQFRDWVFLGLGPATRDEAEELAQAFVDEAWDRYVDMENGPHDTVGERTAFVRAFARRIEHLEDEYRHMPSEDDPGSIAVGALGMMRPETAAGIVTEAKHARLFDDFQSGPVKVYALTAYLAATELDKRSWGEKPIDEVAKEEPRNVEAILANYVVTGRMDLNEAIEIHPDAADAFRKAAALREERLRGGPLTPGRGSQDG